MNDRIDSLIDQLKGDLQELAEKTEGSDNSDAVDNFGLIIDDLREINRRVKQSVVDLDRGRLVLTPEEQDRVDQDEIQDRILDRVKPFLLLSQMMEWDWSEQ